MIKRTVTNYCDDFYIITFFVILVVCTIKSNKKTAHEASQDKAS